MPLKLREVSTADGWHEAADIFDNYGSCCFKRGGGHFVRQATTYGPVRESKGLVVCFAAADFTGNGLPDIVAPGKGGLCGFYNEG